MSGVLVTGIGAITPVGASAPETWEALVAGRSGVGPITSFDASGLPTRIAGEIHGFDPVPLLGEKRARRTARFTQLAIAAAREAVADSGLSIDPGRSEGVGVVVNNAVAGVPETEDNVEALAGGGPRRVSPYYVASTIPNMPACEVAIDLGAHGPVSASALACASGNAALLEARRLIMGGEADVVIAGGTDAGIAPVMLAGLANMGPLSERNDDPEGASRPFDLDRDGFVFGEGAVVLVVESEEHARARGASVVYGELAGGALTSDAFHMSAPEPSGTFAAAAMEAALRRTGTRVDEVDWICAHGTATRANDAVEARAIHRVFGNGNGVPVSSPKSMVGHLIGAAGALSVMTCLLAIRDGVIPPTINLDTPDPECDLDHVANEAREAPVKTAIANAFGFGGQNCVVVLKAP